MITEVIYEIAYITSYLIYQENSSKQSYTFKFVEFYDYNNHRGTYGWLSYAILETRMNASKWTLLFLMPIY